MSRSYLVNPGSLMARGNVVLRFPCRHISIREELLANSPSCSWTNPPVTGEAASPKRRLTLLHIPYGNRHPQR